MPTRDRLTRSTEDKMIAGVAGGLAAYFGIDPTIVRVIWVCLALFGGTGFLVYLIMALVVPRDDEIKGGGAGTDAVRIAEERFARGEINAEELRTIRETLRSDGP